MELCRLRWRAWVDRMWRYAAGAELSEPCSKQKICMFPDKPREYDRDSPTAQLTMTANRATPRRRGKVPSLRCTRSGLGSNAVHLDGTL